MIKIDRALTCNREKKKHYCISHFNKDVRNIPGNVFQKYLKPIRQIWPLAIFPFSETEISIEGAISGGYGWRQTKRSGVLADINFRRFPKVF